ncbi:gustatory receptor for sugar taste 64a isoform X2 [Musca domestica]|uniref:Gustatory receptor for sugar taste 64a isoform X2 n=1 Tax=Musca domestica TaxID=7370 RepID=A0ABM3UPG7_MUSDO|nr:gustatory receptor for sugar taste 64a isoform X2 [Musca domestica]
MSQSNCIDRFSKKSNLSLRNVVNKSVGKTLIVEEVNYVQGSPNGEDNDYALPNYDRNGDSADESNNFAESPIYKPNKNYPVESQLEEEDVVDNNSTDDTFQKAVSPILFLGQCFAILPVRGIRRSNPKHLRFSLKSIQVLITLFFMCCNLILTLTTLKHLLKIGINAKNFVGLAFFGCVQCSCVLFALLAPHWPRLMRYWYRIESIFTQKPYEMPKRNLAFRIRLAATVIILMSVAEHGLYLASAVFSFKRTQETCAPLINATADISFNNYILKNYDYVFQILPHNMFIGVFILIVNGLCTFIWNYMDMFIMMISKGIAYRFEQITTRINKLANKEVPETVFIEIREHYVKLCELLDCVDEDLSGIILLSCINNLYFVCYQLLNVFNKLRWPINYIYFWYSLLYLIGRTAFAFLSAASINDESKGGLAVLRRVSSRTWCVEVERLIFQMTTQTVALSGKKFYFLTRRLLFGMAGTIVTYELVLLQFDAPNRAKGLPDLCG